MRKPLLFRLELFQYRALANLALSSWLLGCGGAGNVMPEAGEDLSANAPAETDEQTPGSASAGDASSAEGGGAPAKEVDAEPAGGGGGAAASADATAAVPPASGTYGGSYYVPVRDELESYALFEIDVIEVRHRGDELELRYDLPALLVGSERGVAFRGRLDADRSYVLDGNDGRATCRAVEGVWRCEEMLRNITLDAQKLEQALSDLAEPEADARRQVAELFAVDPIGVLSLDMTP